MKVKFTLETCSFLTKGEIYEVKSIDDVNDKYLIKDDYKENSWCPKGYFEVIVGAYY